MLARERFRLCSAAAHLGSGLDGPSPGVALYGRFFVHSIHIAFPVTGRVVRTRCGLSVNLVKEEPKGVPQHLNNCRDSGTVTMVTLPARDRLR